ncbi:ribokinase [Geodermatophilus sp. YIM 151500]|uniref:ribokinase n=1 Tax=Geodermatophilus sp. YIM 151500 TaxID=2984531 RepID=UPI0021E4EF3A|nr:ribokinase [Geodermatophilus sp. YIM 151500]MCV2490204.1 ribokinase [Geodermatophilus sp. YIM 151500]
MSVAVVGSINEDVLVPVDRLPGRRETVVGGEVTLAPGGKGANQASAAARLTGPVSMVGRVGDDAAGERQLAALVSAGVDVGAVRRTAGTPTGSATIPVERGSGENLIVVVPGANARVTAEDADVDAVRAAAVLLLQLEIPLATVRAAAAAARGTVVLTPAPARPLPDDLLERVDVLVPNEHELRQLAGAATGGLPAPGPADPAGLAALARRVARRAAVVTLGARGALVVPDDGPPVLQLPPPVTPVDTTGAGDCFCGALAAGLAEGLDLTAAARRAVAAAALSTTRPGARGALPDGAAVAGVLARLPPVAAATGRSGR